MPPIVRNINRQVHELLLTPYPIDIARSDIWETVTEKLPENDLMTYGVFIFMDPECNQCRQLLQEYRCAVAGYQQASQGLLTLEGDEYLATQKKTTELWSCSQRVTDAMISHQELAHDLILRPKRTRAQLRRKQLEVFRTRPGRRVRSVMATR
jgi:hypothetical protein